MFNVSNPSLTGTTLLESLIFCQTFRLCKTAVTPPPLFRPMAMVALAGSDQSESEKLLCPFWDILPGYYRGGDGLQWLLQSDNIQHSIYSPLKERTTSGLTADIKGTVRYDLPGTRYHWIGLSQVINLFMFDFTSDFFI
jgi:hypothetical protein